MTIYSDLNFDLELDSNQNLKIKTDIDAIKQSIKHIILSRRNQKTKFQNPEFGCGINDLLGEKINTSTEILIKREIENALGNFEPRIEVIDVEVDDLPDLNTVNILIKFTVISLQLDDELLINLEVIK